MLIILYCWHENITMLRYCVYVIIITIVCFSIIIAIIFIGCDFWVVTPCLILVEGSEMTIGRVSVFLFTFFKTPRTLLFSNDGSFTFSRCAPRCIKYDALIYVYYWCDIYKRGRILFIIILWVCMSKTKLFVLVSAIL